MSDLTEETYQYLMETLKSINEADLEEQVASQFFADGEPMSLSAMIGRLQEIYCGKIGFE